MGDALLELEQVKNELGAAGDARLIEAAAIRAKIIDTIGEEKFGALARHDPKNHYLDLETVLEFMLQSGDIHNDSFLKAYQDYRGRTGMLVNSNLAEHADEVMAFYAATQGLKDAATDGVIEELERANDEYGTLYERGFREAIDFLGDKDTAPAMRAVSLFLQHPSQESWEAVIQRQFDIGKLMGYFKRDISNSTLPQGKMNAFAGSGLLNLLDNLHKYHKPNTLGKVTRVLEPTNDITWVVSNQSDKPWDARYAEPNQRAEGNVHGGTGVGIPLIEIHAAASGSKLTLPKVGSTEVTFGLTVPAQI